MKDLNEISFQDEVEVIDKDKDEDSLADAAGIIEGEGENNQNILSHQILTIEEKMCEKNSKIGVVWGVGGGVILKKILSRDISRII